MNTLRYTRCIAATMALVPALLLASPAGAAATPLCTTLKQLVAVATVKPSFGKYARQAPGGAVGTLIPAGFKSCLISRFNTAAIADSYSCRGEDGQTKEALEAKLAKLNAEITTCFGVQPVKPGMRDNRGYNHMDFFVPTPGGVVTIYTLTPYLTIDARNIGLAVSYKPGL